MEATKEKYKLNKKIIRSIRNIAISFKQKMICTFIVDSEMEKPVILSLAKILLLCNQRTSLSEEQLIKINQSKKKITNKVCFISSNDFAQDKMTSNERKESIIHALSHHPDILLIDNPTKGLDAKSKKEVMDMLKKLKEDGKCIIIVSTDEKLHTYADESYKMIDGNFKRMSIKK